MAFDKDYKKDDAKQGEEGSVYGLDAALVSSSRFIGPLLGGSMATWLGMRITMSSAGVLFLLIFVVVLAFRAQS